MVFYVGAAGRAGTSTSVPIPPGTQVGDVLLLGGHGNVSFNVTDARMTKHSVTTPPGHEGESSLWIGIYDGNPAEITYVSDGGAFDRDGCLVTSWRSKGVSGTATATGAVSGDGGSGPTPQVDRASRAVLVTFLGNSVVDGNPTVDNYIARANDRAYSPIGATNVDFLSWEGPLGLTPDGTMYFTGSDPAWVAVVLRLNPLPSVAAPCRLMARGDDLDPGGARLYPPPKSQQRSNRGVGFY